MTSYHFKIQDARFLPHAGCSVEFFFQRGEGQLIVGENGVGKSTLLHRLRSDLCHQGSVVLVQQNALDFFYDRSLGEIKKILLSFKQDENLEELWSLFQLQEKEERYLSTLSGGEAQQLKLVSALCLPADFYLLDEPSQSLDQTKKDVLSQQLRKKISQGKSIIVVDHQMDWLGQGFLASELIVQENLVKKGRVWTT